MDLIPFEVTDLHLIAALVIKILIVAFAWWKIKFLTALAGGLDDEKRKLKAEIQKHLDNEAVLKREIDSCNSVIADLNDQIAELDEDLEHTRKNSSDFENEMGNAQHECLRLEDRIKALKGDNEDLQKKLNSQKAHHGKQKKKIETMQNELDDITGAYHITRDSLNAAANIGYFIWSGKYLKAIPVTSPSEKKKAQIAIDNLNEKQQ